MDSWTVILSFAIITIILFFLYLLTKKELEELKKIHGELTFKLKSTQVKHGKSWEHFVPFMAEFEKIANKDNFTFIGMPIDGIAFDDDAIKFIEVKTGKSALNAKQRQVKALVQDKRIEWHEIRHQ